MTVRTFEGPAEAATVGTPASNYNLIQKCASFGSAPSLGYYNSVHLHQTLYGTADMLSPQPLGWATAAELSLRG
jgi:hypothetical protein